MIGHGNDGRLQTDGNGCRDEPHSNFVKTLGHTSLQYYNYIIDLNHFDPFKLLI